MRFFRDPNLSRPEELDSVDFNLVDNLKQAYRTSKSIEGVVEGKASDALITACKYLLRDSLNNVDLVLKVGEVTQSRGVVRVVRRTVESYRGFFSNELVKKVRALE